MKNLATDEFIWTKEITPPHESGWGSKTNRIKCLALSPDGKTVAAGTDSGYIELLDVATGERAGGSRLHPGFFSGPVEFVPGDKLIVVTVGREAVLRELATGKMVRSFGAGSESDDHIPSPDGQSILVIDFDGNARHLNLQETVSGKKLWTLNERYESLTEARFSTDGQIVAIDSWEKDTLYVSVSTGKPLAAGDIKESAFPVVATSVKRRTGNRNLRLEVRSPDGRYLAHYVAASEEVTKSFFEVRDLQSGEAALELDIGAPGRSRNMFGGPVARFSADSKIFAYRRGDSIEFYDLQTKQRLGPPRPHPAPIWDMKFSPSASILAAHCNDSTVILWDVRATLR